MTRRSWTILLLVSLLAPAWSTGSLRGEAPPIPTQTDSTKADTVPPVEVLPSTTQPATQPAAVAADGSMPIEQLVETKRMRQITTDVRPTEGAMPEDAAARVFGAEPIVSGNQERGFAPTVYFWEASNLAHRPLYFEQAYVERYGYNYRLLQPVVSGVEFYTDVAFSPFRCLGNIHRPYVYALGPARPGDRGIPYPRW